jgi:hypothetical protein
MRTRLLCIASLAVGLGVPGLGICASRDTGADAPKSSTVNPAPDSAPGPGGGGTPATESQSPYTGAAGRSGTAGTGEGTRSRDPTKSRGVRRPRSDTTVPPALPGNPASQGPGDAIGKDVPERPSQYDHKLP